MAHCSIKDPETGLWNCWSTIVDDYLFDEWLTEAQYRVALLVDDMYRNMEYSSADYSDYKGHELISYEIKDGKCIITVDDINMIKLEESRCYTKAECDATKEFRSKCDKCTRENCDVCDMGDKFVDISPVSLM